MLEQLMETDKPAEDLRTASLSSISPRSGAQSISAGWQFLERLLSSYSGRLLCGMPNGILVAAYVLARIGESSRNAPPSALCAHAHKLLDCISEFGRMDGGWAREESPDWSDCLTTCWAISALENFGWPVPEESYAFVRSCERWDGSFAASPLLKQQRSAPEMALATTVSAVRILREISPRSEEYLLHGLSTAERTSVAGYVCAEVLDWQSGLASWQLLNSVSRLTASVFSQDPCDLATLLRCLLRLRLQRSWPIAAELRALQASNGSWTGAAWLGATPEGEQTPGHLSAAIVTATAVSSLQLADAQPGLYFGSDLPARRFNQGTHRW